MEKLDRHGRVAARERAVLHEYAPPFRIGSGYENDLILDDPHVEPAHAVLEFTEGGVQLRDLETHNGCVLLAARTPQRPRAAGGAPARVTARAASGARIPLGAETIVRVGASRLRLRDESYTPQPALPLATPPRFVAWLLRHWSAPVFLAALFIALLIMSEWRANTDEFKWLEALAIHRGDILLVSAWVSAWAFANLLLRGEHRLAAHAVIGFGVASAVALTGIAVEWSHFLLTHFETPEFLRIANQVFWAFALLLAHFGVLGVGTRALRLGVTALLACGVLTFELIESYAGEADWVVVLPYWSRLEPVNPHWLAHKPADEYFRNLATLREKIDRDGSTRGEATDE